MSKVAGAVSSSSMISLQRSMHSSQMYTPGPAISFLTWRCDLPQNEQRSCSFESVGRANYSSPPEQIGPVITQPRHVWPTSEGGPSDGLVLMDHAVDDAVLLRFVGAHEVVAFGVGPDL